MHAVVIGAGVIGSSIALQLKRLGHDVTVVERNSAAGMDHGVQWWCQWWDVDHDVVAARGAGPCV